MATRKIEKSTEGEVEPTPVLITAEQPPVPVVITAPDGITPIPIPSLGVEANTPPGESSPVPGYVPSPEEKHISAPSETAIGTPVNVTVVAPAPLPPTVIKGEGITLSPKTTEEQDAVTESQRKINLIWENTQSYIAIMVVVAGVMVNSILVTAIIFFNKEASVTQLSLISISLQFINLTTGIVIGFYFSRTNHSAKGGIGPKEDQYPYTGR